MTPDTVIWTLHQNLGSSLTGSPLLTYPLPHTCMKRTKSTSTRALLNIHTYMHTARSRSRAGARARGGGMKGGSVNLTTCFILQFELLVTRERERERYWNTYIPATCCHTHPVILSLSIKCSVLPDRDLYQSRSENS
jgi:hypothetical protein